MFFFCKQKTAYEMRISDWSSDVCSSDLGGAGRRRAAHGGTVDVGFEVDDPGGGDGGADALLDRVDVRRDLGQRLVGGQGHLRGDEELVGAQVERLDVDDALDLGAVLDRGEDAGVVGFGRALAPAETLGLDAEDDRAAEE